MSYDSRIIHQVNLFLLPIVEAKGKRKHAGAYKVSVEKAIG